jgi:transcriptional regulator of arginine metabolism
VSKTERLFKISEILREKEISNQKELSDLLNKIGYNVTQATVSRDLEDLGAIKIRGRTKKSIYAIADSDSPLKGVDNLKSVLNQWTASISYSHNLVVLKTPPGCAHVVASALDRASFYEIIGTVAGDDTVLIVCDEKSSGKNVKQKIGKLAGIKS